MPTYASNILRNCKEPAKISLFHTHTYTNKKKMCCLCKLFSMRVLVCIFFMDLIRKVALFTFQHTKNMWKIILHYSSLECTIM